jgi:hypothetical protein
MLNSAIDAPQTGGRVNRECERIDFLQSGRCDSVPRQSAPRVLVGTDQKQ